MGLHGVKAVFFDLDNTLIDTAAAGRRAIEEVVSALQSKHRYGEGEARAVCDKVQAKLLKECHDPAKMCITDLRISHWEEAIQETIGGEANRDLAAECYYLWKTTRLRHLTLAEDTRAMLTELRKGLRLLLLTNGDRQTQREKIEACACQPYFDAIVVGGEQKEEKPAPSIFYYCCDLLGVQPAECVMVGDSLDTDIQGGLNAGLKATSSSVCTDLQEGGRKKDRSKEEEALLLPPLYIPPQNPQIPDALPIEPHEAGSNPEPPEEVQGPITRGRARQHNLYPLREMPVGGGQGPHPAIGFVSVPLSSGDVREFKREMGSLLEDPLGVAERLDQFLRPSIYTWGELQAILNILFTAEERNMIRQARMQIRHSQHAQGPLADTKWPLQDPNWNHQQQDHRINMQDLRGIIVQEIQEAVPRGQNINKAFNERQKKEETPTD
ncbi:hypothetical protein DUI87_10144 [Hirundo rustica rustica]|uniref:Core shell protein Gag P30 domain-containing protein n=1 Tax=Hirundo rustica rustica TaxID=333673 RepID=A0A3M0KNP3_HIRRU|nr:hypothetical protein DUI87_10144 [Hirundo rustica rustica]